MGRMGFHSGGVGNILLYIKGHPVGGASHYIEEKSKKLGYAGDALPMLPPLWETLLPSRKGRTL